MTTPTAEDHAKALRYFVWWDSLEGADLCQHKKHQFDGLHARCLSCFAQALAAERARVLAACAAVADNRADTMNRLGKAEQDRGDLGGALRCSRRLRRSRRSRRPPDEP